MGKQVIGNTAGDHDSAPSGIDKINHNFDELYALKNFLDAKLDFGCVGDGSADDTDELQAAFDAASSRLTPSIPLRIPAGRYKVTTVPTINHTDHGKQIEIYGDGMFGATTIVPTGCGGLVVEGTSAGSTAWGITLRDLMFDLVNASATNGLYIHNTYSVYFDKVWAVHGPTGVTNIINVTDCQSVRLNDVIAYGQDGSASAVGILVHGTSVGCRVEMHNPDVEYTATGFKTTGKVYLDIVSPRAEGNATTNYNHGITSGKVNIYGGGLLGGSGCPAAIALNGDDLSVYGTGYYLGDATNFISVPASPTYRNVRIYDVIRQTSVETGVMASGSNLASVQFYPPLGGYVSSGSVDFKKAPTSGSPTALLDIVTSDIMACRLTLYAYIETGYGAVAQTFDFVIPGHGDTGDLTALIVAGTAAVVQTPSNDGSDRKLLLSSPTLTNVSGAWRFGITATASGTTGTGKPITMLGKLEYKSHDVDSENVITAL